MPAYQLKNPPAYKIPISDDELRLIGIICAVWAQVESQIDRVIARLAQLPDGIDFMHILLDRRDMRAKIDMVKRLAQQQEPPVWEPFAPIYQALTKYITKRNDAVHGLWLGGHDGIPAQAIMEYRKRHLLAADLKDIAENLAIISQHLVHFQWTYAYGLPVERSPSHGKLGPLPPP